MVFVVCFFFRLRRKILTQSPQCDFARYMLETNRNDNSTENIKNRQGEPITVQVAQNDHRKYKLRICKRLSFFSVWCDKKNLQIFSSHKELGQMEKCL